MRVVILGCGRVGARNAARLDSEKHVVSVIDATMEAFDRLPGDFHGHVVLGEGIDVDVLRQAGIDRADAFCALSNNDNTNIMASEIAREEFHVDRVITRVYDPGRTDTYSALGLETFCPTRIGVSRIEQLIEIEH
jgi:trk system potassium uptake protein TrkA